MYKNYIKRILDFLMALIGLVLLSPLFVLATIGLFFANQGKPFFFQRRPGKNGKIFSIIKFKTMNDKKDNKGNLLPDADRLTKIGSFVRKTSLDEIPQLINVIKGDMSLIGPRPLLVDYLHLYSDFQNRRHEVKPGITGWAQVNGRNAISWDKKFELDVWYVDHISFLLDVKILFMTIKKVFKREGINAANAATIEPFNGNKIYLFGASGHCKVVIDVLQSGNETVAAIIDDNPKTEKLLEIPVIHSREFINSTQQKLIVSIGDNAIRKKIVNKISFGFHIAIHPKSIISVFSKIGEGTMVMAGAIINANAVIGKHCIINTAAVIEHDCVIEDYVHVSPNATLSGNVLIKEGTHIGVGACVIQGVTIGKWATVGAGAIIISDVPDYAVVVGNPGKIIKFKKQELNEQF